MLILKLYIMEIFRRFFLACMALLLLTFTACKDTEDELLPETTLSISSTPITVVEGKQLYHYIITTEVVNPNGATVIKATGVPSWAVFSDAGDGTAEIKGVAPEEASFSDIVIHAINNGKEVTQSFKLTVSYIPKETLINIVPITTPVLLPGGYDFSYTIKTSVIDPDGDTKIIADDVPDWLTLKDNGNGTAVLSGTAPKVTSAHIENIEISATNNNAVAKLNFTITIKDVIKVACVGNSITFGSMLTDRVTDCYPTQLSHLLGNGYNVGNFGKSGATLLRKGDRPYVNQAEYTKAIEFAPDIVIIKLGTNDTKPMNWTYKSEFKSDANYLIDKFNELPSVSAIYVCTPCKVYKSNYGITDDVVFNGVIPILKEVVKDRELVLIDIYTAVSGHDECFQKDGVHPDAAGAKLIANEIFRMLSVK